MVNKVNKPLAGRGIVVTRPREQANGLADLIGAAGGEALLYPALEIAPPRDLSGLNRAIDELAQTDLAIFISPTAAREALRLIRSRGSWPSGLRAAAIGPGSRQELELLGIGGAFAPVSGADSEALLALPELAEVAGRRIVIFRGEGGRELLGDALAARGARVRYAECYRRTRPQTDLSPLLAEWRAGAVHAVTAFSSETFANLFEMLGPPGRALLADTPVFVPHPAIADAAKRLGAREVLVGGPGEEDLVARLVAYFRNAK